MKKPKPTWPGFMDEIEAVKKAPAIADASFTAFFFSGKRKAKTSQRRCFAFLRMGMKQRKTPLRRRPSCFAARQRANRRKSRQCQVYDFTPSFVPRKKLLIRPMLMRGRAQAFSFDESARSSRLSGISVSSRKNWYSHLPPGCLAGHLQEFLQVIFDASESSDSYEEVLPTSMACPLIRCVHVTGSEAGAPSGPFQFSLSI